MITFMLTLTFITTACIAWLVKEIVLVLKDIRKKINEL